MSRILHVVRADLRRWGLLIALAAALNVAQRLLEERGPIVALADSSRGGLIEVGLVLLTLVRALLTLVTVAVVMHETPIVGRRAFLLTRPVTPGQTILAKLVTLGAAFVVLPALLDFAVFAHRGLPLDLAALDALESLAGWRFLVLLGLLLVAALTSSLVAYLIALASGAALLALGLMLQLTLASTASQTQWWAAGDEPVSLDRFEATRAWLTMFVTCGAPLVALVWRRRRLAIATLGVLLVLAAVPAWPPLPRLIAARPVAPPAWAADDGTHRLALDPPEASIGLVWRRGGVLPPANVQRPRTVHGAVFLPGLPAGWFAGVAELQSRFTLEDGNVITGHGVTAGGGLPRRPDGGRTSRLDAWRETLGPDVRMRPVAGLASRQRYERTVLGELDDEATVARLVAAPVLFDVEAVLDLWRYDVAAVVPQAPARIHRDHALVEILRVRRDSPRVVSVLVRQTFLSPWLRPAVPPHVFIVLKAPDGAETANGADSRAEGTLVEALSRIRLGRGHSTFFGVEGQRTQWSIIRFTRDDVESVAPGWIDRAQIAVVDSRFAGRVRRRLHVDRLTVRDQGNAPPPLH